MNTKFLLVALLVVVLFCGFTAPVITTEEMAVWGFGLVTTDRIDGMISAPALDVYFCPSFANCSKY